MVAVRAARRRFSTLPLILSRRFICLASERRRRNKRRSDDFLFSAAQPFFSSANSPVDPSSCPILSPSRADCSRSRLRTWSRVSLRVSNLAFARVEIPPDRFEAFPLIVRVERDSARARKENVNQASGLGKDGKAPSHPWEGERERKGGKGERNQEQRAERGDEVDRRPECCACMRLPFIRALDRVRAPVGPSMQMQLSSGVGCFVAR